MDERVGHKEFTARHHITDDVCSFSRARSLSCAALKIAGRKVRNARLFGFCSWVHNKERRKNNMRQPGCREVFQRAKFPYPRAPTCRGSSLRPPAPAGCQCPHLPLSLFCCVSLCISVPVSLRDLHFSLTH